MRRDRTFKLVARLSLAVVEAPRPGRGKEIFGLSLAWCDLLWIFRCGGARREREAGGGAETPPTGMAERRGPPATWRGHLRPAPPSLSPRMWPRCSGMAVLGCELVWQLLLSS